MAWPDVNFGKWAGQGKSLPQIVFADPDWFFWAYGSGALAKNHPHRAEEAYDKARAIRIRRSGRA